VSRYEVTGVPAYQPSVWTAIEFEAPEESAPALADTLADSLLEPGWYVNWSSSAPAERMTPPTPLFLRARQFRRDLPDVAIRILEVCSPHTPGSVLRTVEQRDALLI
jgi:hypothetical protein